MPSLVRFFVFQHGMQLGDGLDPASAELITDAARAVRKAHSASFDYAFSAGTPVSRATVRTALEALDRRLLITPEPGFGTADAQTQCPTIFDLNPPRDEETAVTRVSNWLEHWRGAWFIRGNLTATLRHRAMVIAKEMLGSRVDVIVGGHSPGAEFACLDPKTTPLLGVGDAICYEIEADTSSASIVMSTVILAPD